MTTIATDTTRIVQGVYADGTEYGHDAATVTGAKGATACTGCWGVSPTRQYSVYFTWKHGRALLGSSTVVEADSAIEAAVLAATRADGGYVKCDAGVLGA